MKRYHVMRAETYFDRSERALIKRLGDIRDWQIGCVCEPRCNNGWMRQQVEEIARPIMIPLITGHHHFTGQPIRLTPREQKAIATWAVLKAMIAEFDSLGWVTTHHMQRKQFMRTLSPPRRGWSVWIGHYVRAQWQPFWSSTPFFYGSEKQIARFPDLRPRFYNSHISTQVVGQLFIHVIRSPAIKFINNWRFTTPDRGSVFRIWPPSEISLNWPGTTMTDRDADYVASAMATFLSERGRAVYQKALEEGTAPPGTAEALADLDRLWPTRRTASQGHD